MDNEEQLADKVIAELKASNEEEFEEVVRAEIEVPNDVTNPPDASNETAEDPIIEEIIIPDSVEEPLKVINISTSSRPMLDDSNDEGEDDSEDDDDDLDETLLERLVGLTEMFPDSLRKGAKSIVSNAWSMANFSFAMSKTISWVVFSSSAILFLPLMIETERMGIDEAQKQHQRQILLGPGAAVSAGANAPLPNMQM